MKRNIYLFASLLLALLTSSCRNDGFYYQDEARARLEGPYEWAMGADSLNFSFASHPASVVEMPMEMTLYVMGEAADRARTARIEVVADKSSATAADYSLTTDITVPAGAISAPFTVTLRRTAGLQSKSVRLYIRVVADGDFAVGVNEQNHFTLVWSDQLSKPRNWDTQLTEFFGVYSIAKHRFIIDTLGIAEFSTDTMTWGQLQNYRILCAAALTAYNAAHPGNPLTDENGQLVSF
jgi:hypothetical protein